MVLTGATHSREPGAPDSVTVLISRWQRHKLEAEKLLPMPRHTQAPGTGCEGVRFRSGTLTPPGCPQVRTSEEAGLF